MTLRHEINNFLYETKKKCQALVCLVKGHSFGMRENEPNCLRCFEYNPKACVFLNSGWGSSQRCVTHDCWKGDCLRAGRYGL